MDDQKLRSQFRNHNPFTMLFAIQRTKVTHKLHVIRYVIYTAFNYELRHFDLFKIYTNNLQNKDIVCHRHKGHSIEIEFHFQDVTYVFLYVYFLFILFSY